jgi:hypothetical protein
MKFNFLSIDTIPIIVLSLCRLLHLDFRDLLRSQVDTEIYM